MRGPLLNNLILLQPQQEVVQEAYRRRHASNDGADPDQQVAKRLVVHGDFHHERTEVVDEEHARQHSCRSGRARVVVVVQHGLVRRASDFQRPKALRVTIPHRP